MKICNHCQQSFNSSHYCEKLGRTIHEHEPDASDDGLGIGIGFDPACGTFEPTLKLGCGIGIGLDGDLTIGGF